jgi:hypothetical protein
MYHLQETQPEAFIDGIDTMEEPYPVVVDDDFIHHMVADAGMHVHCNFGELGLHAHLISKRMYLASSPPALEMIQDMMIDGDEWIGFRAEESGILTAMLQGAVDQAALEMYTAEFMPIVVNPGQTTLETVINEDEVYVLHASGTSAMQLTIQVNTGNQSYPTELDINDDSFVTALDALLIINHLNRYESGPTGALTRLDPDRDGVIAPLDALLVINYLNQELNETAGEGETAPMVASSTATSVIPLTSVDDEPTIPQRQEGQQQGQKGRMRSVASRNAFDNSRYEPVPWFLAHSPLESRRMSARRESSFEPLKLRHDAFDHEIDEILSDIVQDVGRYWSRCRR